MNEPAKVKPHIADLKAKGGGDALSERVRSLRLSQQVVSSGSGGARFAWTLCLLFAASTAALAYVHFSRRPADDPRPNESEASAQPAQSSSANVAAATTAAAGDITLEAKGYIVPAHQILVSPKVSGMIVKLRTADGEPLQEGKRVKKDEVLAELEDVDYQADYARARAQLELARQRSSELENGSRTEEIRQAKAELDEAKAQLEQLQRDYDRSRRLVETRTVSKEEFEQTKSKLEAMSQRVEMLKNAWQLVEKGARAERRKAAQAEVQQAEADLAKSKWRLDNCKIRAPVSGTILKKNAEEGNIVNPIAFNGSFSLCEMADLSDLEVDLTIQERDISRIFKGQKCKVRTEAFPDRVYEGVVSRLMPIADRAKGAIPVRVKVSIPAVEEGVYLKPEMGAIVSFLKKEGDK